jgi:glycosyltransferase involved in cell wall biosynthesis
VTNSRKIPVTVVIPTLNEADRLPACLASVRWAAEVIVADAGSTDGTAAVARRFGATVVDVRGATIAGQRNAAIDRATQPWVLSLDADERVTMELEAAIAAAVANPAADAYRIHFRNRYLGAPMERGGWGRDRHVRFARAGVRWRIAQVHERLDYDGPVADLAGRIDHDSYRDLEHQLRKVTNYAAWGANDLHSRRKRVGLSHLVFRPLFRFVKCYLLQGAWREGRRGLVLSVVHAWSAFAKYAVLWDLERQTAESATLARSSGAGRVAATRAWTAYDPDMMDMLTTAEQITGAA